MNELETTPRSYGRLESASSGDSLGALALTGVQRAMREQVMRLGPWFHNLHLPDGTQTAPQHLLGDFPTVKWRQIAPWIPDDLTGCRALDIGCNAGFYSFELARRGATVTALDIEPRYLEQARWAARQFGLESQLTFRQASVYGLAGSRDRYDLVCFLGVLYHLRHPLLALDVVRGVTGGRLILQTLTMPGEEVLEPPQSIELGERELMRERGWPAMAFIEGRLEEDPTNWWAPSHACVEAMARAAGFRVVARPGHEIYLCEPDGREPPLSAGLRQSELEAIFARAARRPPED
ncbi:MAG TPA: TIGR04290 family methyltransferase [Steroidobacteraceae bacterium]|nr:TIGR04290 family methyltransferase [Steroidobacteraceae bacterium]